MRVIEIEPQAPVNPFAEDIANLVKLTEENPKAAGEFIVPAEEAGKAKFKIGKAANAVDKTAALVLEEDGEEEGTTRLVYRLKKRHQSGPRKPRGESASEPQEAAESE